MADTIRKMTETQGIVVYPSHEGAPLSSDYTLTANGIRVPVFETCSRYGPGFGFAYLDLAPGATVLLEVDVRFCSPGQVSVLPARYGIDPELEGSTVRCTVNAPDTWLTFVFDENPENRPLHVFVNRTEEEHFSPGDPDVVYFGPGYHEFALGKPLVLKSNQTLYVAGGAWIAGRVLVEAGSHDVRICGRGIIAPDQAFDTRICRGLQVNPGCSRVTIEGIIMNMRVTSWCGILIESTDITIRDYKVVSGAIWSTDGMNPCNCARVRFSNCFFRCGDDTIAIKGFWKAGTRNRPEDDPALRPANEDIEVQGCILWSDNNNALVLGQETKTSAYRNIVFRDCDILHVYDVSDRQGAISLICLDGTDYSGILFENIRIHWFTRNLVNMFFTEDIFDIPGSQKWPGAMRGVTFRNIVARGPADAKVRMLGWGPDKRIENPVFEHVVLNGRTLTPDDPALVVNEFVAGLRVLP